MARTTATFNSWISDNAARLREKLSLYNTFDEDAFQDAYLTLATTGENQSSNKEYEKAFIAAYRKLSGKHISELYSTSHPDDLFFSLIPSEDKEPMEQPEATKDTRWLISRIRKHIRDTFPKTDVQAFEMKMTGYSCRDITDTLGIGTTAINNATNRIITRTLLQFAAVAL